MTEKQKKLVVEVERVLCTPLFIFDLDFLTIALDVQSKNERKTKKN